MPSTLSQPSASPKTDSNIGVERSNELVIPPARNAVSVYLEQTTGQNNAVAIGTRLSDKQLITVDKNGNMFIVSNSVAASNTNKTPTNLKDDFVRISGQETTFRGEKYQPTLSAPGEYIRTLIPIPGQEGSKGLYIENGSTLSTAIVSGTIALMVEANPKISVSEIKNLLIKNSVDTAISDKVEGAGMLDIVKAVKSAGKPR